MDLNDIFGCFGYFINNKKNLQKWSERALYIFIIASTANIIVFYDFYF